MKFLRCCFTGNVDIKAQRMNWNEKCLVLLLWLTMTCKKQDLNFSDCIRHPHSTSIRRLKKQRRGGGREAEILGKSCTVVARWCSWKQGRNLANLKSRRYFRFFPNDLHGQHLELQQRLWLMDLNSWWTNFFFLCSDWLLGWMLSLGLRLTGAAVAHETEQDVF